MIKRFLQDRDIRILTGLFALSRVIFYTAGIRMNLDLFVGNGTAQLPDLLFLKEKLAETLYYMHGQPPLYNLYCGLLLKFFSNHLTLVVHSHFLFLGWLQALVLFKILQKRR